MNKNNRDDNTDLIGCFLYPLVFLPIAYLIIGFIWNFTTAKIIIGCITVGLLAFFGYALYRFIAANKARRQAQIEAAEAERKAEMKQAAEAEEQARKKAEERRKEIEEIKQKYASTVTYIRHDQYGNELSRFLKNYVVIDVETTGLRHTSDKIVELSALKVIDGEVFDTFTTLVNPETSIPSVASHINGITDDMVKDSPTINNVLMDFLDFVGDSVVVGHNVRFDIGFIYENSMRCFDRPFSNDSIDTLHMSQKYIFGAEDRKLTTLAKFVGINVEEAHRALSDCYTTKALYDEMQSVDTINKMLKSVENGKFKLPEDNELSGKTIAVKGMLKSYSVLVFNALCAAANMTIVEKMTADLDYILLSDIIYKRYANGNCSKELESILNESKSKVVILSEQGFLRKIYSIKKR